jgi:hypothetical protein
MPTTHQLPATRDKQTPDRHASGAFEQSVRLRIEEVTRFLVEVLGRSLVMRLAGVTDPNAIGDWATGARHPRTASEQRLRTAYRAFQTVSSSDNEFAARAWFIGLNPQLGDQAPIDAIREDRQKEVVVAAEAFARTS